MELNIITKSSITSVNFDDNFFNIKLNSGKTFKSKFFVEARGISQAIKEKLIKKLFLLVNMKYMLHGFKKIQ